MSSMYWWNDELPSLHHECLAARRKHTRSKGNPAFYWALRNAKQALKNKKVKKDPWGLAFKIVTKKLVTRRKIPGLENADRVKPIVWCLFPRVESFQRESRGSCTVRCKELFTLKVLKRRNWRLKANMAPQIDGVPNEIFKEVIMVCPNSLLGAFNSYFREGTSSRTEKSRGWSYSEREKNL